MSTRSARSRRAFAGDGRGIGEAPGTGALAFLLDLDRALASVAPGEAAVALAVRLTANRLCVDDCAFDEIDDDACAIPADEAVSPRRLVVSVRQGERAVAALTLERQDEHAWHADEIALAQLVAHRCRDSLERARAVREAKEHAAQVRLVADNLPAKISYVDRDLRYRFNNAAYADWYGVDAATMVGKHVREVLGDATYFERLPFMERALAGETVTFESRSEHCRLGMRMTDIACVPDFDAAAAVRGFFVMSVDTTERKRAEEQLRDNDRRKDEFLAMLAHELRNPLAPLANALYLSSMLGRDDPRLGELRQMMERQVRQLTRLIDDLLDVSRISRGRIELRRGLISLGDVLRDATESVRPQVEQRGQMLVVDGDAHSLRLSGDSARLTQVFGNVLGNASKYTQNGGTIALSATRRGGDAVVRVLDNGRGIPHEMLDRVFEMFVQVDPSSESADGGLGIGLALSRRLVELHGGRIEARSEGPGRGTEVLVRLPLAGAASTGANGDRQDGEPAVKRILVVEETKPRDARLQ